MSRRQPRGFLQLIIKTMLQIIDFFLLVFLSQHSFLPFLLPLTWFLKTCLFGCQDLPYLLLLFFVGHNFANMSKSELEQRRQNFPKMSFYRKHAKPRMWGNFLWNQIVPYDLQDLMWPPQNYSKWKDEWMAERDLHKPLFQDHGSLGPNMVFRIQSLDHSLSIHLVYQTHWVISNNEKNTRAD